MEYPLISEYREAILSAEDNFNELSSLKPVLDSHGDPVMSSGNFAVVFKMKNEHDGKFYAVKCFIKDQEGRDDSYRKIAEELEIISSSYILPLRYLENELFVDSSQCDCEEFPVVVMEWVEGETLDAYLKRNLNDKYELEMLSYRFNRMAAWLLAQPFAHGDLKPDNILIRKDGSLVLVDYDGMFVPSMKGEKAREIGSPDYRHPFRTNSDFNEHLDDFSIAVIALSLKAIPLNPKLKSQTTSEDTLLLSEKDFRSPSDSTVLKDIQNLTADSELQILMGIFYIALAKNSLDSISFRLFITDKPKQPVKQKQKTPKPVEKIATSCTDKDITEGIADEFGVIYSKDGKRLLKCKNNLTEYRIKTGTIVICDKAFEWCQLLQIVTIPDSVTSIGNYAFSKCMSLQCVNILDSVTYIGNNAFSNCESLECVNIPDSVTYIGDNPFYGCSNVKLQLYNNCNFRIINNLLISASGVLISCFDNSKIVTIPDSVTSIGNYAFSNCKSLQCVTIPDSVTSIGNYAFSKCESLQNVNIPDSVTSIGDYAFSKCESSQSITIPDSVTSIGNNAFSNCKSLQSVTIPDSVTSIGEWAFSWCSSLQSVSIPNSVTSIGDWTFFGCSSLQSVSIPISVTSIGDGAFSNCKSLQSVTIPDSVISIGERAFSGCSSLQSVSIPNSVTSIGDGAFLWCESLQKITIPDSVTSIGNSAFSNCKSLQSVTIPDSVTSIGERAFSGCSSLQSVSIPDSVTSIGKGAFPDTCQVIRR